MTNSRKGYAALLFVGLLALLLVILAFGIAVFLVILPSMQNQPPVSPPSGPQYPHLPPDYECKPGQRMPCEGLNLGSCRAGFRDCTEQANWGPCQEVVGPVDEICGDNSDNDCDGSVDEGCGGCVPGDKKLCGLQQGECVYGEQICTDSGTWTACEGAVSPVPEVCGDGVDNDCDGYTDALDVTDCACTPGDVGVCSNGPGICFVGTRLCAADGTFGTCMAPKPGDFAEICGDGLDNDCDSFTDSFDSLDCACNNGAVWNCSNGPGICGNGTITCVNGNWTICSALKPGQFPELCSNHLDDDCDGLTDLFDLLDCGCTAGAKQNCSNGVGICAFGNKTCANNSWGTCSAPTPGQFKEICGDGLDNDCDGKTDLLDTADCSCNNGAMQNCSNGPGICGNGTRTCANGTWGNCSAPMPNQFAEICNDNLDNDCDGKIDCADSNCSSYSACMPKQFDLYAVSSLVKLHNANAPYADLYTLRTSNPSRLLSSASLKAARNERESFQLIINASQSSLNQIEVIASDLKGPGSATISSTNYELFYVHFVQITTASDSLGGTGYYEDALPPLNNKFDIPSGQNRVVWIKLNVPSYASAGDYTGNITVKTSNAGSVVLPVSLHVWNFGLPSTPSMTAVMGLSSTVLSYAYNVQGSALDQKVDEYSMYMLQNKVVPFSGLGNFYPTASWNGSEVLVTYAPEKLSYVNKYVNQYGAKAWQFPIGSWMKTASFVSGLEPFSPEFNVRMQQYIDKTSAIYQQAGISTNFFTWIMDEPNTEAAYIETNQWSALVAGSTSKPKFMVTEQITKQNPAWPTLTNISIWCPSIKVFATTEGFDPAKYSGNEWWLYNGGVGADYPSPDVIDREIASARVMPWYIKKFGTNGYMYWAATWWGNWDIHPWNDPKVFDHTGGSGSGFPNGNGYFFYPSMLISQYTPMQNIGGVTGSVRWESFMDGMEDYEYLTMASSVARDSALSSVLTPYPYFSKSPEVYEQARAALAADIE